MTTTRNLALLAVATLVFSSVRAEGLQEWLAAIRSADDGVRMAARLSAETQGAAAVVPLGEIIRAGDREPTITAWHALKRIVHHAGRPGAEAERAPVLRELEKLTASDWPPAIRREAVWLMGFIGGDQGSVSRAAKLLFDEDVHVAENARLILERIPGEAAVKALQQAIVLASDERRPDLIFSIAKKGDPAAVPQLVKLAGALDARVRLSALEGLARLGAVEGVPLFAAAAENRDDPLRKRLINEFLRLADILHEGGKVEEARGIYEYVLRDGEEDFQRERALHRLAPAGSEAGVASLIRGLEDESERVRGLALRRLANLEGASVGAALIEGYEEAAARNKPVLLRALARRDRAGAAPFLKAAAESDDAELMVTALDILDELERPELASTYQRVAESGSATVREAALRGYLAVADGLLRGGYKAKALQLYRNAVGLSEDLVLRGRAIRGIVQSGDPSALDALEPFLGDPNHSVDAANGTIAFATELGRSGDLDGAERHLLRIATGNFPRDVVSKAAEALRALGRDPQRAALAQGFVLDWWLTGPIQDPDGQGLGRALEPESRIELDKIWRIGPRRYRWQKLPDLSLDGKVNLLPVFRRSQNVMAYAYTEIEVDGKTDVLLKMGSDDGLACWLNDERVHYELTPRSLVVDDDVVPVTLEPGKNRLLLKIQQGGGDWGFCLRITDREGKPLDLSAK